MRAAAVHMMRLLVLVLALLPLVAAAAAPPSSQRPTKKPPHLWMILQDDLGHFDVGFNNPSRLDVSGNVSKLAAQGIILKHHYVFYWCSPTRRSFLSGRLPIHHGEMLSADGGGHYVRTPGYSGDFSSDGDDIDLRWEIISQKLKKAGYHNYWYGKGHTGYKSMAHLPINRGFDGGHTGFLTGAQDFYSADRWEGEAPFPNTRGSCTPGGIAGCPCVPGSEGCANLTKEQAYASNLCGQRAVASLRAHDPSEPYFLYLPWQV